MEALRACSLCYASPHRQVPSRSFIPALVTRTFHISGHQPTGLLYGKIWKSHTHLKNSQDQSKRNCDRVKATARPVNDDQGPSTESVQAVEAAIHNISLDVPRWMDAFYRFTRPHTVIGTVVGILSISLLAVQGFQDLSFRFSVGLLQALIPALFMNFYIVGLNQIFDIEIDKVNKPYLPLASGDFSLGTGISVVVVFAILSLGIGVYIGSRPLLWALSVSFILGTAYSVKLPWLRWKRSAFAAASCILSVRAIVVQLAFYMHMQSFVFERAAILTKPLAFATGFMCFFSIVIALFKDIPDLEGDKVYGIQSYTVRLGQERVFWLCIYLLLAAYGAATLVCATSEMIWARMTMVLGHVVLAGVLWYHANRIDLKSRSAITSFYMFIWKLFYAEYLLIPFLR